jgi:hypothetical protein
VTRRGGLVHRLRPVIVLKTEAFLITGPGGLESIALLPCYESGKQDVTEVLGEVLELFGGAQRA